MFNNKWKTVLATVITVLPLAVAAQSEGPRFVSVNQVETIAPRGFVSITFDDATVSQYQYGLTEMAVLGLVGTLFVGTDAVERHSNGDAGYDWVMTWEQVQAFVDAGWEIGSHTHTHPDLTEMDTEEIRYELARSQQLLTQRLGEIPTTFASPLGRYNERVVELSAEYYDRHMMAWGGNEGRNLLSALPNPHLIGRLDVAVDTPTTVVCGEMLQAALNETWTVFIFHRITEDDPQMYEVSLDNFRAMLQCAATLEEAGMIVVDTVQAVYNRLYHSAQN